MADTYDKAVPLTSPNAGWLKAHRNPDALELAALNPFAFTLLYFIAYRAQRTNRFNRYNLKPREALIGDFKKMGMTEQNYRTAKAILTKHGFATFTPTTRGTIATLCSSSVFDVNLENGNGPTNRQPTDAQRTGNDYQELNKAKTANKFQDNQGVRGERISIPKSQQEVEDYAEQMGHDPECVSGFMELNNSKHWNLLCHWKTAMDGFASKFESDRTGG